MAREVRGEDAWSIGEEGRRRESYDVNTIELKSSQMMRTGSEFPGQLQEGPGAKSWL